MKINIKTIIEVIKFLIPVIVEIIKLLNTKEITMNDEAYEKKADTNTEGVA